MVGLPEIQALGVAFEDGDLDRAEEMLRKNPKITRRMFAFNRKKMSWMRLAAREGKLEFVKLFHSYGAILEHKALIKAGKFGHFHVVQYFDEQSVDLAAKDGKLLLYAAEFGNMVLVMRLVEDFQVDCNIVGDGGKTPLSEASKNNHADVAKYLLKRGAKTIVEYDEYDGERVPSPLAGFASHGNITMLKILLKHGAEIDDNTMNQATRNLTSLKFLRMAGGVLNGNNLGVRSQFYNSIFMDKKTLVYIHRYFFPNKFKYSLRAICDQVKCNKLDLVKYIVKHETLLYADRDSYVEINDVLLEKEEIELFLHINQKIQMSSYDFYVDEQWFSWLDKAMELGSSKMAWFILRVNDWHWDRSATYDWWNRDCLFYSLSDEKKRRLWRLVYPRVRCPYEVFEYLPPPNDFTCRESNTCPILCEELEPGQIVACSTCRNPFSLKAISEWRKICDSCPLCKETGDFYLL